MCFATSWLRPSNPLPLHRLRSQARAPSGLRPQARAPWELRSQCPCKALLFGWFAYITYSITMFSISLRDSTILIPYRFALLFCWLLELENKTVWVESVKDFADINSIYDRLLDFVKIHSPCCVHTEVLLTKFIFFDPCSHFDPTMLEVMLLRTSFLEDNCPRFRH